MKLFAVRGGMSGFVRNGVTWGSDPASCLRRALLRHHKIEEVPNEKSQKVFAIGHLNEELFERGLKERGVTYQKELELSEPVTEDSEFCGHSDYVVDEDFGKCVYELKSVTSKNTYKKVFDKGEPKLSNLAQCINYMLSVESTRGRLVYTSYMDAIEYSDIDLYNKKDILDMCQDIVPESRVFEVEIDAEGKILVDKKEIDFTLQDVIEHRRASANVLEKNLVFPDRPQPSEMYNSVCAFCPFRSVCDEWDNTESTETFLNKCKEKLNNG